MKDYSDIINLPHHVSKKRPQMSIHSRAGQFSAFAALTGYEDMVKEKGRQTTNKIELTDEEKININNKLIYILKHIKLNPKVTIIHFIKDKYKEGGSYLETNEIIKKINFTNKEIILSNKKIIDIDDILEINSELFNNIID